MIRSLQKLHVMSVVSCRISFLPGVAISFPLLAAMQGVYSAEKPQELPQVVKTFAPDEGPPDFIVPREICDGP